MGKRAERHRTGAALKRLLCALLLTPMLSPPATAETVPPIMRDFYSVQNNLQAVLATGEMYDTATQACEAYAVKYYRAHAVADGNNYCRDTVTWNGFGYGVVANPYSGLAGCAQAAPPYSYNAASGMCERQVQAQPCLPPNAINPGSGQCAPACPANMSGTPCACIAGAEPNPGGAGCAIEAYTLTLTPDQATIEPGKTYSFTATVTKQDGSPPS